MTHTTTRGFTLIETLIAISIMTMSIIAPMALAEQSLQAAHYERDEIAAQNLTQEGIDAVRELRDNNIITLAEGAGTPDIFSNIPIGTPFTIDGSTLKTDTCAGASAYLQTDGTLYGYYCDNNSTNSSTIFKRTLVACYLQPGVGAACTATPSSDEVRLNVTTTWTENGKQTGTVTIVENLYRWVVSGAAAHP